MNIKANCISVWLAAGTALSGATFAAAETENKTKSSNIKFAPKLTVEATIMPLPAQFPGQYEFINGALIATGEISWRSEDRSTQVIFEPFGRLDARDDNRTYADIRRGYLRYFGEGWDITVGADRVFWGVAESINVVDVINQRDGLENADLDEKLGQSMVRFSAQGEAGNLDLYYLPYFRERQFVGPESRNRFALPVDTSATTYDRGGEEWAGDFAARYSNQIEDFDIGVSYFYGTSRAPFLEFDPVTNALNPRYQRLSQIGLDVQYTSDAWLLKLEAAHSNLGSDKFFSAVGGVEYTFFDIASSGKDLGLIAEYLYDGRNSALSPATPFDNDLFLGGRLTWNDSQDTALLAGAIIDLESGGTQFKAEFERRIGDKNLLELEARAALAKNDPLLTPLEDDASLLLRFSRFF